MPTLHESASGVITPKLGNLVVIFLRPAKKYQCHCTGDGRKRFQWPTHDPLAHEVVGLTENNQTQKIKDEVDDPLKIKSQA